MFEHIFKSIAIIILILQACAYEDNSLQLVQIFFRHGERTPISRIIFPNEPSYLIKDFPYELGELTNKGMWQEYTLGSILLSKYGTLLGGKYDPYKIKVYSGVDNRTSASAQLVISSLLPPRGNQIWNQKLKWRPVPIVSNEIIDHVSFGMFDHCSSFKSQISTSPQYNQLNEKYYELMHNLSLKSGLEITDLYQYQNALDIISTRRHLKYLLPLPKWADNQLYLANNEKNSVNVHSDFVDLFLDKIGGWHFDQILDRIDDSINNRTQQKIILFSSHDTNMLTIGRLLNINDINNSLPEYGSYLAVELHKSGSEYFVKMVFKPNLNHSAIALKINDCQMVCPLEDFQTLGRGFSRISTVDWISICNGVKIIPGYLYKTYLYVTGFSFLSIIILIWSIISLVISHRRYKRCVESRTDPENAPLLSSYQ